MSKKYVLGLDQGTTGTSALLFDENWKQVAHGYKEVKQYYPRQGWVEHDGKQVYETLLQATENALKSIGASASEIDCIGIDNQGESVIAWDKKTGEPVYPVIVWQDRRTSREVDEINEKYESLFIERTGLKLDAYFGATKIRWVLKNIPLAQELLQENRLMVGSLDSWFIWKLTGGKRFITDCVTASRTCLFNIHDLCWDEEILSLLEIPKEILPQIQENAGDFGVTAPHEFFGQAVPITASIVDQQSALIGQGCCQKGEVKTTYGTGCFMLMNTGETLVGNNQSGLLSTLALVHNGRTSFALDGGIYIAGAATKWLENGIKIVENSAKATELAKSVKDNGGVFFVPAFTGLAAPHWDSYARGTMFGITAATTQAHIARATLEANAYQVKDIFDRLCEINQAPIKSMRVDGGGTNSDFLMQFQADILGIPVEVPEIFETTALGSAYLAGLGRGRIASLTEISTLWKCKRVYEPNMSADNREYLLRKWHRAVERAKGWELE